MISNLPRRSVLAGAAAASLCAALPGKAATDLPGVIMEPGPEGWWDARLCAAPRVLREGDGRWRMWYYGRDAGFPIDHSIPTGRVGVAESDDGVNWRRVRGPLTQGAVLDPSGDPNRFDDGHVGIGGIAKREDGYWMSFLGGPSRKLTEGLGLGFPLRPGIARSPDGLNWTKIDGPHQGAVLALGAAGEFDELLVGWPQLLAEPDGSWKMYYHTLNRPGGFMIGLAVSQDGLTWEKVGKVMERNPDEGAFDAGGTSTRHVLRQGSGYVMIYEGADARGAFAIGLATSDDGINWRREKGPKPGGAIVARGPSGAWDAGSIGTPWLVANDAGGFNLYYLGRNEVDRGPPDASGAERGLASLPFYTKIALQVSDGADLTRFRPWNREG